MTTNENKLKTSTKSPKNHAPYQIQQEGEAIVEYLQPTEKWKQAFSKLMRLDSLPNK